MAKVHPLIQAMKKFTLKNPSLSILRCGIVKYDKITVTDLNDWFTFNWQDLPSRSGCFDVRTFERTGNIETALTVGRRCDVDEFPQLDSEGWKAVTKIPAEVLTADGIIGVGEAAAVDDTRPPLTMVRFEANRRDVVATDGVRLYCIHGLPKFKKSFNISPKVFHVVHQLLAAGYPIEGAALYVKVEKVGDKTERTVYRIHLRGDGWTLIHHIGDNTYPEYWKVYPNYKERTVWDERTKSIVLSALDEAIPVVDNKTKMVIATTDSLWVSNHTTGVYQQFKIGKRIFGAPMVSYGNSRNGEAYDAIGMNGIYLKKMLEFHPSTMSVGLGCKNVSQITFESKGMTGMNYYGILMPLRIIDDWQVQAGHTWQVFEQKEE